METYFASKPMAEIGADLEKLVEEYYSDLETSGLFSLLRKSYRAYYGIDSDYASLFDFKSIRPTGEQGELSKININHYRNLITHLLVMATAQRPAMEARATNTDYKSMSQTILAQGILEYYLREKRLERYLKEAVEQSLVFGEGFLSLRWDAHKGEQFGVDPETGAVRYDGDIVYKVHSPLDVIRDKLRAWDEQQWIVLRTYVNRFDLIAKYPEYAQKLGELGGREELMSSYARAVTEDDKVNQDVAVYEFYHLKSEALPNGRHVLFCSSDVVLFDGPLPYRDLPVYRVASSDLLGSAFGYSHTFDLLPIQEAVNSLHSTALTNNASFGVQNIVIPKGADISVQNLAGGLNLIEEDAKLGQIRPLQLTATAPETYNYMDKLERTMETLSGVNQVSRGDPQASLKSGAALALVASQAIQFNSGLAQAYNMLLEQVGTATINLLRDYAKVPRIAMIAGKFNKSYMKEFTGDDLSQINRVVVDAASAISKTTAGRVEMANQLLQSGMIKTPDEYISVINTGRIEPLIEGQQAELMTIRRENELLREGQAPVAMVTDDHRLHIVEHKSVTADPDARNEPGVVQNTTAHIQEHIDMLRNSDPDLLMLLGQQPLQPMGMPQGQMPMDQGQGQPMPPEGLPQTLDTGNPIADQQPNMPSAPTNPLTGEKAPLPM